MSRLLGFPLRLWMLSLTCVFLMLALIGCGRPSFDAKGLVFSYPDGFTEAEGGDRRTLILRSADDASQGVLAVHWQEQRQPDARTLITAALEASGVDASRYNRIRLERIDTVEVDGAPADYVELIVEHDEDGTAEAYHGRLLLFEGPDDTHYILGYLVDVSSRDDRQTIEIWEGVYSSLQFQTDGDARADEREPSPEHPEGSTRSTRRDG